MLSSGTAIMWPADGGRMPARVLRRPRPFSAAGAAGMLGLRSVGRTAVNRIHVILAVGLIAIGLILVLDSLSSRELERPLGLFALIIGVIWAVGRFGWWIVWKDPTKRH